MITKQNLNKEEFYFFIWFGQQTKAWNFLTARMVEFNILTK